MTGPEAPIAASPGWLLPPAGFPRMPDPAGLLWRTAWDSIVGMRAGRRFASYSLAFGIGIALLAAMLSRGPRESGDLKSSKVTIGTQDEIYYSHAATEEDAKALGQALRIAGFFVDRGNTVFLAKGARGTLVSFVLKDGVWDRPGAVSEFGEIGRRVAASVGGLPINVLLVNSAGAVRKKLAVGKAIIGARDEIYYVGSATNADAQVLGQALKAAGFFRDTGLSVELTKGEGTAISFVVSANTWERPEVVAGFEHLSRRVAAAIGWLPIKLRLLNTEMVTEREALVQ